MPEGGHSATDMTRNSLFRVCRAGLLDRWMFFQTVTSEEQTALQFSECKKSTEGTLSVYPATATMSTGRNDVTRIRLKQLKVFIARLKRFISKDFCLFLWEWVIGRSYVRPNVSGPKVLKGFFYEIWY